MEINTVSKALREEDFDNKLQHISSFFSSDLDKFKLETQLKTLTHTVDEKQVGIKMSEVLKLGKLIFVVLATNVVLKRPCSTLYRIKTYLQSSMTQEHLSSYLILATYKEQVDKLKLVEVANQFCFENEHRFSIQEQILPQKVY